MVLELCLFLAGPAVSRMDAQSTGGSVAVTVVDPSGAVVPEAGLELLNLETNDDRKAVTSANGTYAFKELPFGRYKLVITKTGFATKSYASVQVQTARVTDINATLTLGGATETVTVLGGETPVVDATSSQLADTIDTKQVVSLPVNGRNIMSFAFLVPGWSNTTLTNNNGTWNNMPGGAVVGADFDGTPGISNRFRSGGFQYGTTAVQPRIEDVGEMTIARSNRDPGARSYAAKLR